MANISIFVIRLIIAIAGTILLIRTFHPNTHLIIVTLIIFVFVGLAYLHEAYRSNKKK